MKRERFAKYLILLVVFAGSAAKAQQSPYFPATGNRAVEQDVRDIQNPKVCLFIATAPGLEDLPSIAYFRIGMGARVAVVYLTNGEEIPSDLSGETFYRLASRRKAEAYRALSYLGADPYFLNIPADELPVDGASFRPTSWFGDNLKSRLDSVLSQVKPDMILLDRNPLSWKQEPGSFLFVENLLVNDLWTAAPGRTWQVGRLYVRTDAPASGIVLPVNEKDTVWQKSYTMMAHEAEQFYRSLRYQIRLWGGINPHRYVQAFPVPGEASPPAGRTSRSGDRTSAVRRYFGFRQVRVGEKLKQLLPAILALDHLPRAGSREQQLGLLQNTTVRVDKFIREESHLLGRHDLRILTAWKLGLDRLRCAVLGVDIRSEVSDTVVTRLQLFFLSFRSIGKSFQGGRTRVVFPGVVSKEWIVNEAQNEFYDWKDGDEFRVVTPHSIASNSPETPEGFAALKVRTPFPYIVIHNDSNSEYDFVWRGNIPLIAAPFRSVEILTPQVAAFRDSSVIISFKSNVRGNSSGEFYVGDSIVSSPRERVELRGKDYVVTDTLPLIWKDTSLTSPVKVQVWASGGTPIGSFTAYPLSADVNVRKRVGILSTIENSPLGIAADRLGLQKEYLDTADGSFEDVDRFSTIVLDRFSYSMLAHSPSRLSVLKDWVESGGRLLVMPQYGMNIGEFYGGRKAAFSYLPITPGQDVEMVDSTENFFRRPNRLTEHDIASDAFPGAFGEVARINTAGARVLVASKTGNPLVVEYPTGRGSVILCALNLEPRLLAVDEGAYKLFANLLSN